MKVRMKTLSAGPLGVRKVDDIVEVSEAEGAELIAGRYAELVEAPKRAGRVAAPKVEAPVVAAPKVEAPVVAAPKVEAPVVAAPKVEAPVVAAPEGVVEIPKEETPEVKVETPKAAAGKAKGS